MSGLGIVIAIGVQGLFASWQTNKWELLKTCCADEYVISGARRTLGTCALLNAIFVRSRRFLEVPKYIKSSIDALLREKMAEKPHICLISPFEKFPFEKLAFLCRVVREWR